MALLHLGRTLLCFVVRVASLSEVSEVGTVNITAGGIAWVTTMEGGELEANEDKISLVEQGAEADKFTSMESMLQWAIGHSDPEKLKGAAKEAMRLTPTQLEKRRSDIKELMDRLKMPSDAELMKIAIADLQNSSLSAEDRERALQELLVLVEPIDNANDLDKLGGLKPVIDELDRPEEELRTLAAWVLGKASQNNLVVQKQVLKGGALPRLMEMTHSNSSAEAVKALYAVSAIVRNFPLGQEAFYLEGGPLLLQELMGDSSGDIRLRRKSLFLVADLAEQIDKLAGGQLDAILELELNSGDSMNLFNEGLLKTVVNLLDASDMDTQEKALMAIRSLFGVSDAVREKIIGSCNLSAALERVKLQLHDAMKDTNQADFAKDLETIRQEVVDSVEEYSRRQSNEAQVHNEL
ncbi:unnamed protein product [Sphagnum jensenii]|uniref:Nucleotide exchange factor Fes1 domain-containing protein n=1 Tax=Sphagnum jensenii TaxID=128206 RepID=A0ABP0WB22_9BRYO